MDYQEKIVKSETLYEGKIVTLKLVTVEMPNKKYAKRELIEHPGAVIVIPVFEDDTVMLVHNYRNAVDRMMLELPAGLVEYGESPIDTAHRELMEETGYTAEEMTFLFDAFPTPGTSNEKMQFFLAKGLKKTSDALDEEVHGVERIPLKELLQRLDECQLMDGKTIMGCLYLHRMQTQKNRESE